ncbi:hypothetical protein W03_18930 [Nitrosomonas sp. PY1]|nr:hypothetical protein W03_18930 [Nitrosomonas sp. PY1]
MAANPNLWTHDKSHFNQIDFEGTRTVLAAVAKCDIEVMAYTSTESIAPRNALIDELAAPVQRTLAEMPDPYCRSKFLAEQEAYRAIGQGMPVIIVAPTLPIGPGNRNITPPTKMILNFLNHNMPAYLDCGLNMIDVRDVAKGHILAAKHGRIGGYYIFGNENLTLATVLQWIEEITGLPMPKRRIPYWLALVTGVV